MSRTAWPRWCTIAEASRLFAEEGVTVHRSNLSRFIDSRKIPKTDGKVDPNALFDRYQADYGRALMAGQTAQPAPTPPTPAAAPTPAPHPAQPAPEAASDPARDLKELQARKLRLELAEQEGRTLTAERVAAALAEARAALRSTFDLKTRDEAAKMLAELGLPGHMQAQLIAALRRFAGHAQAAWADEAAKVLAPSTPAGMTARERFEKLVAYDLDLRGLAETADARPNPHPEWPA